MRRGCLLSQFICLGNEGCNPAALEAIYIHLSEMSVIQDNDSLGVSAGRRRTTLQSATFWGKWYVAHQHQPILCYVPLHERASHHKSCMAAQRHENARHDECTGRQVPRRLSHLFSKDLYKELATAKIRKGHGTDDFSWVIEEVQSCLHSIGKVFSTNESERLRCLGRLQTTEKLRAGAGSGNRSEPCSRSHGTIVGDSSE